MPGSFLLLESPSEGDSLAPVKICYNLFAIFLLGACSGPQAPLVVKQFVLRDEKENAQDEPMIRMEKERRLRGAVSMAERKERLGQYYTFVWSDAAGVGDGPVEVVFQYQQGATGSLVKRMVKNFPAQDASGTSDFAVIGKNYFEGGKVLAWKATVTRGKKQLATRQSYLWQ